MIQELYECGGVITGGQLRLEGRRVFEQAMRRFADGPVAVRVSAGKRPRTSNQNRYFHGVLIPVLAQHCGYRLDEMKDALALELIPHEVVDLKTGEVRLVPGHTSQLTVSEFNTLIERAQQLAAELGCYVPDPREVTV
jgi:hypothetical protein